MPVLDRQALAGGVSAVRLALAAFVLAWVLDVFGLRGALPIWLPFAVALGLELHFFLAPQSPAPRRAADRGPQPVDRERYGYAEDSRELVLVHDGDEDLWVPYSGESGEDLDALVAEARERAGSAPEQPVPPPRRSGRSVRQLAVGLAVIGALAGVVAVAADRSGWNGLEAERRAEAAKRFSGEAARIVGRPVSIRCDESGDFVGAVQHADGVAALGGRLAYLTPERCYDLYRLAYEGEVSFGQTARSLAVLAHEAWHLRGVRDEGTVECYALQTAVDVGRRLGLSEATARQMMRQQLVENSLRAGRSAEYRVPPGCRDGGPLDLHPARPEFP